MSNVSQKPMITTIIPTYRRPKLLRRAIRSVLNQTYPHFQVCVYDNASGDETASVVAEMAKADSRVKYHCHPENIGAFRNFLYGMEHVETPFFSFLSDDDLILPESYQMALEGFNKYPDAIFSAGATIHITDQGRIFKLSSGDGYYTPPEGLFALLEKPLVWQSILFRKDLVEEVGILDQDTAPSICFDIQLRTAVRYPFVASRKPWAISVSHPTSVSVLGGLHLTWPGWLKVIRNLTEDERIPSGIRIYAEQVLTKRLKRRIFHTAIGSIIRKNFDDSYKTVEVLRNHYHLKNPAFILEATTRACEFALPVYKSIVLMNDFRKFIRRMKARHLQKEFGHYARLLEL